MLRRNIQLFRQSFDASGDMTPNRKTGENAPVSGEFLVFCLKNANCRKIHLISRDCLTKPH